MSESVRSLARGDWYHVRNQAAPCRHLFGGRTEARMFLSGLARVVRDGWIEVHGYCLLRNEFHLLVQGSGGLLSTAMRSVCQRYARWYRQQHPASEDLFHGRCQIRAIADAAERRDVLSYIESWPLHTSVAADPGQYPFASAFVLGGNVRRPAWLTTRWIESEIGCRAKDPNFGAAFARSFLSASMLPGRQRVESRLRHRARETPLSQQRKQAKREDLLAELRRRAACGPQAPAGASLCTVEALEAELAKIYPGGQRRNPYYRDRESLRIVLLRDMCGLSWQAIEARTQQSHARLMRCYADHCRKLEDSEEHVVRVMMIAGTVPLLVEQDGLTASLPELIPWEIPRPRASTIRDEDLPRLPWRVLYGR